MLTVSNPIILPHRLSGKTIDILRRRIAYLVKAYAEDASLHGIVGLKALSPEMQNYIDTKIRPLGYRLHKGPNNEGKDNAILAYYNVYFHDDRGLGYNHSTVFIPFDIPGETRFLNLGHDGQMKDLEMKLGDIVIFDQNKTHRICFNNDTAFKIKYGMALFLDKIPNKYLPHPPSTE